MKIGKHHIQYFRGEKWTVRKTSEAWNVCFPLGSLVRLVKLRGSFPTFVFIFSRIYAAKTRGGECVAGTYVVAVQSGAYAPCYGDAHWRVTGPLWLKIGKLAASKLCEYFVFAPSRANYRLLPSTFQYFPRISGETPANFPPLTSQIGKKIKWKQLRGIDKNNWNVSSINCLEGIINAISEILIY